VKENIFKRGSQIFKFIVNGGQKIQQDFWVFRCTRRTFRRQIRRVLSGVSGVELCDDHHTLLPVFFLALAPLLGPPLRLLLPGHLHESLKGPAGGPDTNPSTSATNGCKLNGPRGGVNAWRPSSQAIQVVPMAAISSTNRKITPSRARQPRGTALCVRRPRARPKKVGAFSALGGGFLLFPIGDRRCTRTRASASKRPVTRAQALQTRL